MKFSMFIHPPRPTPRSTIGRPDRVANPRPDVWRRIASFMAIAFGRRPDSGRGRRLVTELAVRARADGCTGDIGSETGRRLSVADSCGILSRHQLQEDYGENRSNED